jgi:hypothetical protein
VAGRARDSVRARGGHRDAGIRMEGAWGGVEARAILGREERWKKQEQTDLVVFLVGQF